MSYSSSFSTDLLTPPRIVAELDRHIIGQHKAKKAVAIALRNRWRRKNVTDKTLQEEIVPKNILMIGPTGVGKTEIARRLAKLVQAPFLKVEATKFTEVGYVGRDVDSIIRDLVEIGVNMVRKNMREDVEEKGRKAAEERILDVLTGEDASEETREAFRKKLQNKSLDDKMIEIEILDNSSSNHSTMDVTNMPGLQMGVITLDIIGKALGNKKTKTRNVTIGEAYDLLTSEESEKLIDDEKAVQDAISLVENDGIVFLDEIDKIASRNSHTQGEVSREGVQRDLLPLLEGTIVSTKYGPVKSDYILFIASGAFHLSKPSDLLPELQGRLPIRVELEPLSKQDMICILKDTEASILKQYSALLKTENLTLEFEEEAIEEIAHLTEIVNKHVENIGARRLHTMMEKLLEEISFNVNRKKKVRHVINAAYVRLQLEGLAHNADLSKFIL